jgi:uncharacterized protein (TIGR03435 family)
MQPGVTDKPVVDQTGLTDRYEFNLKWIPPKCSAGPLHSRAGAAWAEDGSDQGS